jgi:DNA-binding CsgD family transcriptional regulator/energy-coupling factor transporter ATP-binding protein EcfA2
MELVERETALHTLRTALADAAGGSGRTVLVAGEAGVGKTSLLRALADVHGAARGGVWWGGCDALETPHALGPLLDIAREQRPRFAAALGGPRPALFDAVLDELRAAPRLLVVEDVHWADEATLDLLKYLGRRIARTRSLLVLSYRDDEVGATHPLRRVVGELPADALLRLPLARLSPQAVQTLAARAGRSAAGLHALTQGNAFFVAELLRSDADGVPATVQDLVLARLARLPAPAQALVRLAAVMPTRAEQALVQALLAPAPEAVEAALASGLLLADGQHWRFRHELARRAVEAALSAPAAQALHAQVLAALQQGGTAGLAEAPVARLVHHAARAGDAAAIARLAPAAAAEAATRGANREAAALWRTALRQGRPADADEHRRWLEAYLHSAWMVASRDDELLEACHTLERLARERGDLADAALSLSRQSQVLVGQLRHPEANAVSRAALALVEPLPPSAAQCRVWQIEAWMRMLERDCADSLAWSERALAAAQALGDAALAQRARSAQATALLFIDYAAARRQLQASAAACREAGQWSLAAMELSNLGSGAGELMQLHDAEPALRELLALVAERELDSAWDYASAWLALVRLARGDWHEAGSLADAVLQRESSSEMSRLMAWLALARLRARRGDPGVAEALAAAERLAAPSATLQRLAPTAATLAEAAMLQGEPARAAAAVRAALPLAQAKGHAWFVGELAYWGWRAGIIDAAPVGCAEPWALQIGGRWREAAAAWQALDCPYHQAQALAEGDAEAQREALALLDRLGAPAAAEALRRRLREAGVRGVARGARASTREHPIALTRAERHVLALMVQGLRNAEIAARLHRSVRTVDHHVAAVLAKGGCSSRLEAVRRAEREGWLDPSAGGGGAI